MIHAETTIDPPPFMPMRVSAYEQGRRARMDGKAIHESPPFKEMLNQQQWQEGWTFQDTVERMKRGKDLHPPKWDTDFDGTY
jgi:ribosome modulation factor